MLLIIIRCPNFEIMSIKNNLNYRKIDEFLEQ